MLNTSNPSSLQISGSSNQIDFNVLTNDFINAKITGSASVGGVYYHSWIAQVPVSGAEQTLQDAPTLGVGTTTQNPAVTLDNVQLTTGTYVVVRFRSTHNTYGAIYDAFTSGAGTSSATTIVPSVGTLMEWRGEFQSGMLKVYDFANNWYTMLLSTLGGNGWRFYGNSSVLSVPPGWFIYAGSTGSVILPNTTVFGRAASVDVVLPCTSNGLQNTAIWNGFTVANDPMRLLRAKDLSNPGNAWATCIRLNAGAFPGGSSTGWVVTNCATEPYTL